MDLVVLHDDGTAPWLEFKRERVGLDRATGNIAWRKVVYVPEGVVAFKLEATWRDGGNLRRTSCRSTHLATYPGNPNHVVRFLGDPGCFFNSDSR